jgi:hypothetical protein
MKMSLERTDTFDDESSDLAVASLAFSELNREEQAYTRYTWLFKCCAIVA